MTRSSGSPFSPRGGLRIRGRLLLSFLGLALGLIVALTILMDWTARRSLEAELATRLESIAAAATTQIDRSLILPLFSFGPESGERIRDRLRLRLNQLKDATDVRRIYILDRAGRDQLDTDPAAVLGTELPQARVHRSMLEQVTVGMTASSPLFRDPDGEMRKTGYAPLTMSGEVLGFVGVEADARFLEEIDALRRKTILAGLIGFIVAALLSVYLARGLTRPLSNLVEAARAMGRGDLDRPIPVGRPDEIGFLARTLDEARGRLAERDRSLRAMVAGIAHEVRNPLGGIQIYAELLENDPSLTLSQRERVRKVLHEIHRLGEIVEEFITYARPQVPERVEVDPASVVAETMELLSGSIAEKEITISTDPPEGSTVVIADPGQIRQVLLNLARNAIEASPPNGKVLISWERQGSTVAIVVEDEGAGVPRDHRDQIFEPFFTTKADGAGLGLSIVRHLTEQNGGQVNLERAQGGGCRFVVRLEAATEG